METYCKVFSALQLTHLKQFTFYDHICFWLFQYDLELVFAKNSHEFVHEYLKKPEYVDLMRRLGALGDGNQDKSKCFYFFVGLYYFPSLGRKVGSTQ